jgi:hypothetical protein
VPPVRSVTDRRSPGVRTVRPALASATVRRPGPPLAKPSKPWSEPADNDIRGPTPSPRNIKTTSDKTGTTPDVLVAFPPKRDIRGLRHPGRRHERGKDGRDSAFRRFAVSPFRIRSPSTLRRNADCASSHREMFVPRRRPEREADQRAAAPVCLAYRRRVNALPEAAPSDSTSRSLQTPAPRSFSLARSVKPLRPRASELGIAARSPSADSFFAHTKRICGHGRPRNTPHLSRTPARRCGSHTHGCHAATSRARGRRERAHPSC